MWNVLGRVAWAVFIFKFYFFPKILDFIFILSLFFLTEV